MPLRDRDSNPFWPPVPPLRRRWPKVFVIATAVSGLAAAGFVLLLNG